MRIANVHRRRLDAPAGDVAALLSTLASDDDRLWPHRTWPPMRFDRPLGPGADGGHGPIRYVVESVEPGRSVTFRFTGPPGLAGTHAFEVATDGDATALTHTIDGRASARFALPWLLVYRPLHDALVEDALDRAERETCGEVASPARWSWWVRMLRRLAGRRRR
ncbi:MAG: SRPBCC family protein [Actinobacteria bacterium]|nr:SRPBCC family protein [Actinomycetota bacterium]